MPLDFVTAPLGGKTRSVGRPSSLLNSGKYLTNADQTILGVKARAGDVLAVGERLGVEALTKCGIGGAVQRRNPLLGLSLLRLSARVGRRKRAELRIAGRRGQLAESLIGRIHIPRGGLNVGQDRRNGGRLILQLPQHGHP